MKLSELKQTLDHVSQVNFVLPNGTMVPAHFHLTEMGLITRHFVDCGGIVRADKITNMQLWVADDIDHRLEPGKFKNIISMYEHLFGNEDLEIEVEYQTETVGKYKLAFAGDAFQLLATQTDCLAKETCGVPDVKKKIKLVELQASEGSCCTPGGGCC